MNLARVSPGCHVYPFAVVYLGLLPYEPLIAQKVYVDENALMPAVAQSQLEESSFTALQQTEAALRKA